MFARKYRFPARENRYLKILFLVNGTQDSAAAARAKEFAKCEENDEGTEIWQCAIAFRPVRKWHGIQRFLGKCLSMKPDLVYVMDTAYAGVLAAFCFRAISRCPVIVDTGDAAFALARSTGNYSHLQLWLIRAIEWLAMHTAEGIIVRGSYHRPVLERSGVKRVEVIPDGVNVLEFQNISVSDIVRCRQRLGLCDNLVIGMVGTMEWSDRYQMCYGWDIIEALPRLRDARVKALLVGDGNGRLRLEKRARDLGVADQVIFVGRIELEQIGLFVAAMDICVSTQSNDQVGWVRTTGKLPLYLACGKYVIATDVGEAHRVLRQIGHLLPYQGVRDEEHPIRLADHVRRLVENPEFRQRASGASSIALQEFDYGMLRLRMKRFCTEVLRSHSKYQR